MVVIDYGHSDNGVNGAKVFTGKPTKFLEDGRLVAENGGEHVMVVPNKKVLWTGMWSAGIRPADLPALPTRPGDDAAAQEFSRLSIPERNKVLKKRDFGPVVFRVGLGQIPEKDYLLAMTTPTYRVSNVEDYVHTLKKAHPYDKVLVTIPSDGIHGGEAYVIGKKYDFFEPIHILNCGRKDGISPMTLTPAGQIEECVIEFKVTAPRLKLFQTRNQEDDHPSSLKEWKFMHQGKQEKKMFRRSRELSMHLETMDWGIGVLKDKMVSREEVEKLLDFYQRHCKMGNRTRESLGVWSEGSLYDLAMTFARFAPNQQSEFARTQLQSAAGEVLVLGGLWEQLMEEL